MFYSVIFGSQARGDSTEESDFDVLLINIDKESFNYDAIPKTHLEKIDFVEYSEEEFWNFYDSGSLFLYHVLKQGVVIDGCIETWQKLSSNFCVQTDFSQELKKIKETSEVIKKIPIFGGKYLTPLSNIFTELKNACIFSLAHRGIYEFNKINCLQIAIPNELYEKDLEKLKLFYDYVVREQNSLPFNPNDRIRSEHLLQIALKSIEWLYYDCCPEHY